MSNSARLTINGALMARPDLFAGAVFPERLNRETLIDNIILECGELGLYYTNPDYMYNVIRAWTRARIRVWEEMIDTTEYEYNPIWNKDGVYREHRTDTRNRTGTEAQTAKTDANAQSTQTTDDDETITNSVNAYNGGAWQPSDKTERAEDITQTSTSKTGSSATSDRRTQDDEAGRYDLERVEQGNIGVTTTQQMIKEQREVIQYEPYAIIADEFKSYFCILIY